MTVRAEGSSLLQRWRLEIEKWKQVRMDAEDVDDFEECIESF
jgi:hypothetical protein